MSEQTKQPMYHTTYHSLEELGIAHGALQGKSIYLAQDEYTRQYHRVDVKTWRKLCDGSWLEDEVLSLAFTGNVGLIDIRGQLVGHSYDMSTPKEELENFDALVGEVITERLRGRA
jgi:hypothetical protein